MIVLVSGATRTMHRHADDDRFGYLFTPTDWGFHVPTSKKWAADNGAYSGFNADLFQEMLNRIQDYPGCLFVAAPDVVADFSATDALWRTWEPRLHSLGFPAAYVLQDGCRVVPWETCQAVFVGGSTEWKLSPQCAGLVEEAKQRGKWCHMGRVNSRRRVRYAVDIGIDSIDGTMFSKWPDIAFSRYQRWDQNLRAQPRLPL